MEIEVEKGVLPFGKVKRPWSLSEGLQRKYMQTCLPAIVYSIPLPSRSAQELLEKHAGATADRPHSIAGNIMSGRMRILLIGYGDHWRKLRK
jgi:hypothetical protein